MPREGTPGRVTGDVPMGGGTRSGVSCPPEDTHTLPSGGSVAGARALGAGRGLGPHGTLGEGGSQVSSCSAEAKQLRELCPAGRAVPVPTPCPLPAPRSPGGLGLPSAEFSD